MDWCVRKRYARIYRQKENTDGLLFDDRKLCDLSDHLRKKVTTRGKQVTIHQVPKF